MSDRLTLATAGGLPLVSLAFHAAMGTAALVAGSVAIAARKGGAWHRRAGVVYVWAMIAMGLSAVGISVYEGRQDVGSGALAAYLVFTAWTTVKPLPGGGRPAHFALMLLTLLFGAATIARGVEALDRPGNQIGGVPAGMMFFLGTVFTLAAVGDARVLWQGPAQGTRRLARHLWRMCFGLFIASGSFVAQLVRMQFMPDWTRSVPVIVALAAAPLVVLVYWMWRIRLRQNVRGVITRAAVA